MENKTKSRKRKNVRKAKYNPDVDKTKVGINEHKDVPTNDITSNDPDWYIYDQTMFEGVMSMPTLEFKGRPIHVIQPDGAASVDYNYQLPDVVAYYMNPSPGTSESGVYSDSALNLAARKIYAELSASNAKTSNYAPEDVATLILSLGQIIAMAEYLKRAYGVVNYYNFYNRAIPKSILQAMGIDYDNVKTNLSDFRARINQIIARIDTIQFPKDLNYFRKCEYIYKNIFVDRDDHMPTFHFMTPYSTWLVDEAYSPKGTVLRTHEIGDPEHPIQYHALTDTVNAMIDAVLMSATYNYIFADIINLINRNVLSPETLKVEMLPIDYQILPLYSEQFNWQIMNMTIHGEPDKMVDPASTEYTISNNVYADTDSAAINYNPRWLTDGERPLFNIPVRLPDTNPGLLNLVEFLVYYNTVRNVIAGSRQYSVVRGLSDYYCVKVMVYTNGESDSPIDFESNYVSPESLVDFPTSLIIAEPIHTPYIGVVDVVNKNMFSLTKVGTFTQVDNQTVRNMRYQTILGLFRFRR